jgi:hypothetical protein
MGFEEDIANDLAALFETGEGAEFAQAATYTPEGGAGIPVAVILAPAGRLQEEGFSDSRATRARCWIRKSQLGDPAARDTVTVSEALWIVDEVGETEHAWVLALIRDARSTMGA